MISPIHPRALFRDLYPRQFVSGETGSLSGLKLITARVNLPVIVIRVKYQSAPCVLPAPRRGRGWYPSVASFGHLFASLTDWQLRGALKRLTPLALRLPAFSRRYSRDHSRRAWNFCRALPGWSIRIISASIHACQQAPRVLNVLKCPGPFVGALFHARNKSMEMNAWRAEKPSIRSVK